MNKIFITLILLSTSASAQTPAPCMNATFKKHILNLTFQAIDQAYKNHVSNLFEVWLKDLDSTRWEISMDKGIVAYERARQSALDWNPPICKG